MAIRRITCKGGPLHGKRHVMPVGSAAFYARRSAKSPQKCLFVAIRD